MTLEEAIKNSKEKVDDTECGKEHEQLAEWLEELKDLRSYRLEGKQLELLEKQIYDDLLDYLDEAWNLGFFTGFSAAVLIVIVMIIVINVIL